MLGICLIVQDVFAPQAVQQLEDVDTHVFQYTYVIYMKPCHHAHVHILPFSGYNTQLCLCEFISQFVHLFNTCLQSTFMYLPWSTYYYMTWMTLSLSPSYIALPGHRPLTHPSESISSCFFSFFYKLFFIREFITLYPILVIIFLGSSIFVDFKHHMKVVDLAFKHRPRL